MITQNPLANSLTDDQMYQIIVDKDASFEGIFVTAVKTTGIFCKPNCTARKPKRENVEFFSTVNVALSRGYRPCKVCQPMKLLGETPPEIQALLRDIEAQPFVKIRDHDLHTRGLEPHTVRRWFKKQYQMTFQAYQRMMRMSQAFTKIQDGESVTASAFESGFESLSGFNERFRSIFEHSPRAARRSGIVHYRLLATPLGTMLACATAQGVCLLEFLDRRMLETELKDIARLLDAAIVPGSNDHLTRLERELGEYFAGTRTAFSCPLHAPSTAFQQSVWEALQNIPFGTTASYKQQAEKLQKPSAVRAVAHANGANRIAILIPCHRIVGENGELKGYGGGVHRKQWLLRFEQETLKATNVINKGAHQ
jgi:AraC family transcriptional regulator, regulatory protein of adaptative response / methylated-DNA-[protein]-cysteine methyltransferase